LTSIDEVFYSESDMFPKHDELSPDLVWMLQSNQVDDDTLIEALVDKYYPRVYNLALSRLTYPEEARRTAQETFVQAILESPAYRGAVPVAEWLEEIASRIVHERGLSIQDQQLLNPRLVESINKSQKDDDLASQEIERAILEIKSQVSTRKKSNSRKITSQVFGLLGVMAIAVLFLVGTWNNWSPESNPESTPTANEADVQQISGEITASSEQDIDQDINPQSLEPLTINSSSDEIRERIQSSTQYWDTLWAELIVTLHGPASYVGPPMRERHQFWIDPQHGGMLVSGPVNEFPNFIERFSIPSDFEFDDLSRRESSEYAIIGSEVPWFSLKIETLFLPFVLNYLSNSTISGGIPPESYTPVGEQIWAGHKAIIVDLVLDSGFVMGQILLDSETGIVLKEKYYDPASNEKVIIESQLKDLKFNQPMPTMWKRPDSAVLSLPNLFPGSNTDEIDTNSETGLTFNNLLPAGNVSINIDPARSKLSFLTVSPQEENEDGTVSYNLFADDVYIGDIDLINPLRMICTRSPNGKRIAFAKWSIYPGEAISNVFWFDLDELQLSSHRLPEIFPHWIGFSPDNRLLAMVGPRVISGKNQFFMLDMETGAFQNLPITASFNRVAWSPDGTQILVLEEAGSSFDPHTERTINAYSASDGKFVDQLKVEVVPTDLNTLRIHLQGGEAEFKLALQDIASCTAPPGY